MRALGLREKRAEKMWSKADKWGEGRKKGEHRKREEGINKEGRIEKKRPPFHRHFIGSCEPVTIGIRYFLSEMCGVWCLGGLVWGFMWAMILGFFPRRNTAGRSGVVRPNIAQSIHNTISPTKIKLTAII